MVPNNDNGGSVNRLRDIFETRVTYIDQQQSFCRTNPVIVCSAAEIDRSRAISDHPHKRRYNNFMYSFRESVYGVQEFFVLRPRDLNNLTVVREVHHFKILMVTLRLLNQKVT